MTKAYILFDHDGVLVDTEPWYYKAGQRALAEVGLSLDKDQYVRDMSQGLGTWDRARAPDRKPVESRSRARVAAWKDWAHD